MDTSLKFLYLNEEDMINAGVKNMDKCILTMEDMFMLLHKEDYRMGGENANEHGIRVSFPKESDVEGMPIHKPDYRFMAMPAYLGGRFKMFGIKSYGSNPDNAQKGLPRSILMMSLMDATTGAPLAYMSANILSAMRTGATSGVGAKHLSVKNPKVVSIIGPGTMSKYTLYSFITAQPSIEVVRIKGRSKRGIDNFISYCKKNFPTIKEYIVCNDVQEVCKDADIVFYGTTNAAKYEENPTVKKEWLKKGALVIAASALLVDTEFLSDKDVKLISDNYKMYDGWGSGQPLPTQKNVSTLLGMGFYDAVTEGKIPREAITDMGEILTGEKSGRDSEEQIILYAVGGMPIEDVAWGYDCYMNAINNNIGTELKVWDKTEL
ncbi:ornithine cyclodeaminase [Eubacterium ventriosum]|uniref:Ornithine cyclodeaminase n=1 Tax=Eubacterium ventriosum TaxID=39496 RepID=A0A413TAN3_9FIRM|nr:ornithine cyclodeaminase [Eubacterium ventriosum]